MRYFTSPISTTEADIDNSQGNADQATWALTAMNAAERNFSAPPSGIPSWLKLAQNTFDSQAPRWDKKTCKGGLRWQIFPFNNGYNYKNGFSNGQFMQLAARLYALTGNQTYSDWAELAYSWAVDAGIVKDDGTTYDGAQTEDDCSQVNKLQLTSNSAVWLYGSAVMANATKGDKTWTTRAQSILNHAKTVYIKNNIMVETACETNGKCSTEQRFFKGIFAQHLARTMQMMPSTADTIKPIIQANAQAVAKTGCENANNCVYIWTGNSKNGGSDLGSQFSSLQAIQGNLADRGKAASSSNTSSTSTSGGPGSSNSSSTSASGSSGTASQTAAPTGAAGELKASSWTALVLALASVCAFGIA